MKLAEAMSLVNTCRHRTGNPFTVFLACGFTVQHLQTFLIAHLSQRMSDRNVSVQPGLYGDLAGSLERFKHGQSDAAAIIIEWEDIDPRLGFRSADAWGERHYEDILATAALRLDRLRAGIARVADAVPVAVMLPTLPLPSFFSAPLSSCDRAVLSLQSFVCGFAEAVAALPGIRIVNPYRLACRSPHEQRLDLKSELRWGFPYTIEHTSVACELLSELMYPAIPKKGIITDLDETLWHGILGEDGVEGVSWDLDHGSHQHCLYQRMLVSLADTGILIGVATKNDPYMVEQVFKRTDLIISPDMLFPVESHWGPKSESVSRILRTWNIGAESVVFIDDSAMEIAEVKTAFPQITGFVFPAAPDSGLKDLLETLRDLCGKAAVSDEDRLRAASVRQSRHLTAEISQGKAEEFLAQVQAEITLTYNRPDQRAFDLINKTNQFNLNGRRIDESAWRARNNNPRFFLLSVSYRDKFGPLGTIAVVSGTCQKPVPLLDIWVMSCRAFSRRIEHQIAMSLFDFLDADILNLALVSTERNGPIREFIDSSGAVQDVPYTQMQRESFLAHCPQLFAKVQVT